MPSDSIFETTVSRESHSDIFWWVDNALVLTKRSLITLFRSMDQLMGVVLMPVMFLLLFRYTFGGAIDTGDTTYVNFLIAGILVQTAAFGASTTTLNVVVDLSRGVVDRFRSMPMASAALLVSHTVADLFRNTLSSIIMLIVSFLVGLTPTASLVEWGMIFGVLLLFTFAFSWLSAVIGLLVKSIEAAQWVGFLLIMPLTFASSAFVPTESMPYLLRVFAENQPFTHVVNAIRALMVGTPMGDAGMLAVAWSVGILIVCIPLSVWLFENRTVGK